MSVVRDEDRRAREQKEEEKKRRVGENWKWKPNATEKWRKVERKIKKNGEKMK